MEAGAAFLLLLIVIFVAVVGGGLWLTMSTLRRRKLNPEEDKLDRQMLAGRAGDAGADGTSASPNGDSAPHDGTEQDRNPPEHHRVGNEQSVRSVPRR
jgi:hypothetical protein